MNEAKDQVEPFNFVGNRLCIDFCNTLHDRNTSMQRDHFGAYSDLVWWSEAAGILLPEETQRLLEEAKRHPAEAKLVLQRAVVLREAIYRIFSAIAREDAPEAEDLQILNTVYAEAMSRACVVQKGSSFVWEWSGKEMALDRILWDIARSAAELLVSEELALLHECAAEDCGWLFLDTSKNHTRRWCDMKNCGNRAKVGRHYERTRRKQS